MSLAAARNVRVSENEREERSKNEIETVSRGSHQRRANARKTKKEGIMVTTRRTRATGVSLREASADIAAEEGG